MLRSIHTALAALARAALVGAVVAGASSAAGTGKVVTVKSREFAFEPAKITVSKGQMLTIVLKNMGAVSHNLTIDSDHKTATIASGETAKFKFTPESTGTLPFFCSVPGHKEVGMRGTLIVVE